MNRASLIFLSVVVVCLISLTAWLSLSEIEESVMGVGEVVPQGKVRMVRAPLGGTVSLIAVKENDEVKKGQVLVELDPEPNAIEQSRYQQQLSLLQEELQALRQGGSSTSGSLAGQWMQAARSAHSAKRLSASMQIDRSQHERQQASERLSRTSQLLEQNERTLEKYKALFDEGGLSELEVQEFEQQVLSQRGEKAALEEEVAAREAAIAQAQQYLHEVDADFQQTLLNRVVDVQKRLVEFEHNAAQAQLTGKRQQILAPVDGIIHQQNVRGVGDVVQSGENLISVVPKEAELVAEVKISNMDLSYIHLDQRAALRFDAFPMEKFGRMMGTVVGISPATIKDQRGMAYYVVQIRPDTMAFSQGGQEHRLKAGMTVSSDLITRKRTLASFLMEPLKFKFDRALRDPSNR